MRPEDGSGTRLVTVPFVRADRATSWRVPLDGMIQGALTVVGTEDDELLVAGDSTGQVLALDRSGQSQWSAQVEGEIRHDLLSLDVGRAVGEREEVMADLVFHRREVGRAHVRTPVTWP